MIKCILFDFDGTIADSIPHIRKVVKEVSDNFGLQIDFQKLKDYPTKDILNGLEVPLTKIPFILLELRNKLKERYDAKPIPGMIQLLNELSKGHEIGIVSSNSKEVIMEFCNLHKLHFINHIEVDTTLFGKDHLIKKILDERDIDAAEAVYVGDEERDIEAARKAGTKAVAVTWGLKSKALLERFCPDHIADTPSDINKIIKKLQN